MSQPVQTSIPDTVLPEATTGGEVKNAEARTTFLNDLLGSLVGRGRSLRGRGKRDKKTTDGVADLDLVSLGEVLLSRRGEASGVAIAQELLERYAEAAADERLEFLQALRNEFGVDADKLKAATATYLDNPSVENAQLVHFAGEPRRRELFRRLNLADGGTTALVQMREEMLTRFRENKELRPVGTDLFRMFRSWFNRGFLEVRNIDWTTSANILEKIIKYEAVHEIHGWEDLRRRTEPTDRRCFAFFHPALDDDPLIFVEVALLSKIPTSIQSLLTADREVTPEEEMNTAVFYSISNCQDGLRGISFGNFLIKQVAQELKKQIPTLERFVTLSPVPGFSRWLDAEMKIDDSQFKNHKPLLEALEDTKWVERKKDREALEKTLRELVAHYLVKEKHSSGLPLDPVARFHLGNGAQLEQINWLGDVSPNGLKQSYSLMVNYLYDLPNVEKNHEALADKGEVVTSPEVAKLVANGG